MKRPHPGLRPEPHQEQEAWSQRRPAYQMPVRKSPAASAGMRPEEGTSKAGHADARGAEADERGLPGDRGPMLRGDQDAGTERHAFPGHEERQRVGGKDPPAP